MPFSSIESAKEGKFPTTLNGVNLTLGQVNKLAEMFDAIKAAGGADEPMAVAISQFKRIFKKEGDRFVKVEKNELETIDIMDVEIFSGEHDPNGHAYTERDVQDIVDGYHETKVDLKPYIKIGHDENQKLAQNSGMPALGWIENVSRNGKKIVSDFMKVPKKLGELIKSGAYRRVSTELFSNLQVRGKQYKNLLRAVALLGADTPACGDLADIMKLYGIEVKDIGHEVISYDFNFKNNKIHEENEEMEKKELEEKIDGLKIKVEKFELDAKEAEIEKAKVDTELAAEKEAKGKLEKEKADVEKNAVEAEIKTTVESLIKDKNIVPAHKDAVAGMLFQMKEGEIKKYKIGEDEKPADEVFVDILKTYKLDINEDGKLKQGEVLSDEDNSALAAKALKYAKDNDVTIREATLVVARQAQK